MTKLRPLPLFTKDSEACAFDNTNHEPETESDKFNLSP